MKKKGKKKKVISKYLEYLGVRFLWFLLSMIPFRARKIFGIKLAHFLFRINKSKAAIIEKNLTASFPDKDSEWIQDIKEKNITYLGRFFAEFVQLLKLKNEFLNKHVISEPDRDGIWEYFKDGALVISAHLGNWEWTGARGARWFPEHIYVMAKRQSNPWSNSLIERARLKAGMLTVYAGENNFKVIKLLKKKKVVVMVADQFAGNQGLMIPFFGRPASTFLGPAVMARVTGAKIFFSFSVHVNDKVKIFVEPLNSPKADRVKEPMKWEEQFTVIWTKKLEERAREYPEQYFWIHNRWKQVK
ncbi:MAG: hypothetical protein ABUK01_12460 [Leptospirales bacterium]